MLADSAFLMAKDFEHVRRKEKERASKGQDGRQTQLEPLYTPEDVPLTTERFRSRNYREPWELFPGVTVEYYDAGHILGSALTTFEFRNGANVFRLGMSGDLGRSNRPILRDPETHPGVDVLVLESTYGDRLHPNAQENEQKLIQVVTATAQRGGRVLIPAFAVGRAQSSSRRSTG
jgi:metallo-beta-lactamase family protein